MNFSMPSYLIGVGTVVGAIALGFGGGVLLTSSAVKETANPPRVERVVHSDSTPARSDAPKIEARVVPIAPPDHSTPPAAPEGTQAVVALMLEAPSTAPQTQPTPILANSSTDQQSAAEPSPRDDQEKIARRRAERRAEQLKLYAQQKAKALAVARMRQPQFEQQSTRPEMAFEREDVGFNFFGRSSAPSAADRD